MSDRSNLSPLDRFIVETIESRFSMKHTEIITEATAAGCKDLGFEEDYVKNSDMVSRLNQLVEKGFLVEIEYVVPQSSHRVRSIYMPAKAEINVKGRYNSLSWGAQLA